MNAEPFSMSEPTSRLGRVAILWRGDEAARRSATPETSRFKAVFAALADVGVDAEPVVYEDDVLDAVRAQLATLDGVLVWVNPIHEGRNRANLDALLREVAARGVWVSAHPDVILKMGTKEVLHRTRTMSWGCDTALYRTAEAMRAELPARLAAGPRVIKRNRGNGGQGVWKVETLASPRNPDGARAGCHQGRIGGAGAGRISRAVRRVFRRRLRDRSAVPGAPERRCGALLHGRRSLRRLRPPEGQGPGRCAGRARRGRTAALHLQCRPALPAPAPVDGRRVDAAADLLAGHPAARPADDLGRGLHARPARRRRDRQLRAWRDQRQFGVPDSRRGAGRDRAPSCRSAAVEADPSPIPGLRQPPGQLLAAKRCLLCFGGERQTWITRH